MIDRPLAPCPSCNRHVAESVCPFCGAALASTPITRPTLPGRFSRAAVFAGATLAGCWTSSPATETTTKTTPPSDATPAATGRGRIEGELREVRDVPPNNEEVTLSPLGAGREQKQLTDDHGKFVFDDVAPGEYRLSVNTTTGPVTRTITVRAGTQQEYLAAPAMHMRHRAPNMPYGAPPARYRVV